MHRLLVTTALLSLVAAPAFAANTAIIEWNSANPAGAESATGTGNASLTNQSLDGITITLSNVNTSTNPDELTEGNINVTNTTTSTQTLDIIAGGNGFIGPSSNFGLTGTIGVTSGVASFQVAYFVDSADTLNGTSVGPVVGTTLNSFDTGNLTGPFSKSENLTGLDSVNTPYGMAENLIITLQPGANVFVDGASIEAVPGPTIGAGLPGFVIAAGALAFLKRRRLKLGAWMAAILGVFGVSGAYAQSAPPIDDPLHLCYTTGCSPFNGVTIGATGSAGLSNWGFSSSPPAETGTSLDIVLLIPSNEAETVFPTITGQNSGVPLSFGGPFIDVATFGPGQDLTTVLGIPASPPNPYSAYAGATAALDPGFNPNATPYIALEVTVPTTFTTGTAGGQTPALDNTFALSGGDFIDTLLSGNPSEAGIPNGAIVTGFLLGTDHGNLSTAQSSSVVLDTFSVVPGPTVGAGVPGLVLGVLAMIGFNRMRRGRFVI